MGGCDLDFLCLAEGAPEREALCLRDPAAENQELMRTTLLPGLLQAAQYNVRRRVEDVALFEIGRVFLDAGARALPEERQRLSALCMGSARTATWNLPDEYEEMDFYWLKGVLEQLCLRLNTGEPSFERGEHDSLHTGRSARVMLDGQAVGHIGEIAPDVQRAYDLPSPACVLEIDLDTLLENASLLARYSPQPRFPAATRDLAVVVDDDERHTGVQLVEGAQTAAGEYLESVRIFDVYTDLDRLGQGRKSVAMRLTFRHPERTLTDAEVDEAMQGVIQHMERKLNGEARTW
jgi:phenylalanyl-tRNA synthetase beta chain